VGSSSSSSGGGSGGSYSSSNSGEVSRGTLPRSRATTIGFNNVIFLLLLLPPPPSPLLISGDEYFTIHHHQNGEGDKEGHKERVEVEEEPPLATRLLEALGEGFVASDMVVLNPRKLAMAQMFALRVGGSSVVLVVVVVVVMGVVMGGNSCCSSSNHLQHWPLYSSD